MLIIAAIGLASFFAKASASGAAAGAASVCSGISVATESVAAVAVADIPNNDPIRVAVATRVADFVVFMIIK